MKPLSKSAAVEALKNEKDETRRLFIQNYINTYELREERRSLGERYSYLIENNFKERHPQQYKRDNAECYKKLEEFGNKIEKESLDVMSQLTEDVKAAYIKVSSSFDCELHDVWYVKEKRVVQGCNELQLWFANVSDSGFGFNYLGRPIPKFDTKGKHHYFYPLYVVEEKEDSDALDFQIVPIDKIQVEYKEQEYTKRQDDWDIVPYIYLDKYGNPPKVLMDGKNITSVKTYVKMTIQPFGAELYFSNIQKGRLFANAIIDYVDFIRMRSKEDDSIAKPSSFEELNHLIGLNGVKAEMQTLTNFVKMSQQRESLGMKTPNISYHCVFTGNPGTGKTTVARILAGVYRELGVLKKGHLVETDRSGLVAEYVGQTAVKTNKIIDSALDGVLFIDEAYSLTQGGNEDYGSEAIATLLKRMEDDRDRLVVVLAGYTDEIETFINSNPGLRSRFNRYIHFEDYTAEELFEIFCLQVKKNEYSLSDEAIQYLKERLNTVASNKPKDFGNARYVRNLFEKTIEKQANRLATKKELTKQDLLLITKADIATV